MTIDISRELEAALRAGKTGAWNSQQALEVASAVAEASDRLDRDEGAEQWVSLFRAEAITLLVHTVMPLAFSRVDVPHVSDALVVIKFDDYHARSLRCDVRLLEEISGSGEADIAELGMDPDRLSVSSLWYLAL